VPLPPVLDVAVAELTAGGLAEPNTPSIDAQATLDAAIQHMLAGGYERLLVLDDQGYVAGLLDTNAKVVSESLLGGMVVVLEPGGDKQMLKAGGEIERTQGAVPLSELIAKFMFGSTGSK
jgi:phospholipid/cholesterol/gamma-HCH transport system substrate-binding protein